MNFFGGGNTVIPPQLHAIAQELGWFDGARTGLFLGLVAGFVAGVIVACLLRERKS